MINRHTLFEASFETLLDSISRTAHEVCEASLSLIAFEAIEKRIFRPYSGSLKIINLVRHSGLAEDIVEFGTSIEITDASQDDRFWDKSYVVDAPHIRFIAGIPIKLPLGEIIGVLCVLDVQPRYLSAQHQNALDGLASVISKWFWRRKHHLK